MTFEISKTENRRLNVHHVNQDGIYITTQEQMLIQAGEGLPARSTVTDLIEYQENEVLQLQPDDTWKVIKSYIGKTAYAKNPAEHDDYAISHYGDIPETHTLLERQAFHVWDELNGSWSYEDALYREDWIANEKAWQARALSAVERLIPSAKNDLDVPELYDELRVYSESDYYALMRDRKLLVEYLIQEDFPDCGRPVLSGLANTDNL